MIKEKTVFILGAGASCPYGYPSGQKLREEICDHFVSDSQAYFDEQEGRGPLIPARLRNAEIFKDKFFKSSTKSIDLFLARNSEFMLMGKWAIIFRILAAERKSCFREHMKNRTQDWYSYLFERLTEGLVRKDDYKRFCKNDVSFVTFNYDRSLEHFLYESLLNAFNRIGNSEVIEQLNEIPIIHVFGQVAGLDWQDLQSKIEYGREINGINVERLVENLRIIYEEENNPELEEARKLIGTAQHIFFLGFAYGIENLEILNIPEIFRHEQKIYGTALKFTNREINSVYNFFLNQPLSRKPNVSIIENMDCLALLREYL